MVGNILGNLSAGLQPVRRRYRSRGEQTPQTRLWDCAKKQQAKPKGEGISGGGVLGHGVGHVEMPQRYQKMLHCTQSRNQAEQILCVKEILLDFTFDCRTRR